MAACAPSLALAVGPVAQRPRSGPLSRSMRLTSDLLSGPTCSARLATAASPLCVERHRLPRIQVQAEYREGGRGGGGGGFLAGFVFGGVVCGALAFVFAPQLSKTLLGENDDGSPRKLPKWLGEDDSLEATRRKMNEKLAELNRAIDRTSAEILGEGSEGEEDEEPVPRRMPDSRAMESIDAI